MPRHTGEFLRDSKTSRINDSIIKPNNHSSEEEFLSSQDSLDSSVTQDTRIRSTLESEVHDSGCEPSKAQFLTSTNSLDVGKTTMFQEFYHCVNGVSMLEERTNGKLQQCVKQSSRVGRNDIHSFHPASGHPCSFGNPQKQQLSVATPTNYESYYSYIQGLDTFQMNGEEFSWPNTASIHNEFQNNTYMRFGITGVGDSVDKPTEMQHENGTLGCPELPTMNLYRQLSEHSAFIGNTPQSRSHTNYNQTSPNHHLEGQKTFQSEGKTYAESSHNSHILGKERGMNNMLAERIKEFLNRLVRDHGSIDLEWLRHAPPDKVKLSSTGLQNYIKACMKTEFSRIPNWSFKDIITLKKKVNI
ncbi:unnamed protein product [Lathyrus sativus]|nr:unnamed protein product [Lathyrus sativus]